jgi:hypothetical protein
MHIQMKKINRSTAPSFGYTKAIARLAVILLLGTSGALRAQEAYRVADPDIKVLCTSNLHNWSMEAKDISCSAKFGFGPGAGVLPQSLTQLDLVIPVHNLKSGESLMDSRAYSAMKAEYVNQVYMGYTSNNILSGGKFNGVSLEASIAF